MSNLTNLNYLFLSNNQISDISPLKDFTTYFEAFDQEILLPTEISTDKNNYETNHFIVDINGSLVNIVFISQNGKYENEIIKWEGLNYTIPEIIYNFTNNSTFSGTVQIPLNWYSQLSLDTPTVVAPGTTLKIRNTNTSVLLPNNLPLGTIVTVTNVSNDYFANNLNGLTIAGDVLNFEFEYPNGMENIGNFNLTMKYNDGVTTEVDIFYYDEELQEWIRQYGTINEDEQTITIELEHFSIYGVFAIETTEEQPDEEDEQNGTDNQPVDEEQDEGSGNPSDDDSQQSGTNNQSEGNQQNNKNNEQTVNIDESNQVDSQTESNTKVKSATGDTLPKTSTNYYTLLLLGFISLFIGISIHYLSIKSRFTR